MQLVILPFLVLFPGIHKHQSAFRRNSYCTEWVSAVVQIQTPLMQHQYIEEKIQI